jgi:hypothetical protein
MLRTTRARKTGIALAVCAFLASCAIEPGTTTANADTRTSLGKDKAAGTQALVLTGSSLDAKVAAINGRSVDASSVSAVSASVAEIFASDYPDGAVIADADASSPAPDYLIDFTAAGEAVSDIYYGVNIQIESKQFFSMPLYRELVRHLKIDIARFPGGQERVRYDRNAAAGATWKFGDDQEYQYLLTGPDVANYISLCRDGGFAADLECNAFTDDPEMWAGAADQIANGLGYGLKYMSFGNEPDINTKNNWNYFGAKTRAGAMESYANRYLSYASAIRAACPGVTFILGELSCNTDPDLTVMLDALLAKATANPPGAVSAHWYLLGDYGQSESDPGFPSIAHLSVAGNSGRNIRNLATIEGRLRDRAEAHFPGSKTVIGEWGTSWSATARGTAVLDSLATALYTAEVLEYGKTLGIDSMQYFSLSDPTSFAPWNIAMISVDGESMTVRPQYYVRMMHKYAWGDREIPVANGQSEAYSVYASKNANANYLMLINRTNGSIEKRISATTSSGARAYDALMVPRSVTIITLP